MTLDPTTRVSMLETMILARHYRQVVASFANPAPVSLPADEATGVGAALALALHDRLVVHHGQAAALLGRGAEVVDLMADASTGALAAASAGAGAYIGARHAALHRWAAASGVLLTSTVRGSEISLAPGAALALRAARPGASGVTAVLFDASSVTETLIAQTLQAAGSLPLLLISTHAVEPATEDAIDGQDVEAVYVATVEALRGVRADGRARRLAVHLAPGVDGLARATERLLEQGLTSPGELAVMHHRAQAQVSHALAAALSAPRRMAQPLAA